MTGRRQNGDGSALVVLTLSALAACVATPPDATVVPSPTPTRPTQRAFAERISSEAQLIGGPTAKGRLGDFLLANEHVRFVVAAVDHGEGYAPFGGNLLDADVVRAPGAPGASRFGELILTFDLRVPRPSVVEVVETGVDGGPAIIEARGVEASVPLLEALLPDYAIGGPRSLDVTVRYTLQPGARHVDVDYAFTNVGSTAATITLGIAGLIFGDGAEPYVPGVGFAAPSPGTVAPYYAAVGDAVSYLFVRRRAPLNFLVEYSGILAASHSGGFTLGPGESRRQSYAVLVDDRDLSALQAEYRRALVPDVATPVLGRVTRASGTDGVVVHATEAAPRDPARDYASRARVDASGAFHLELPAGDYVLTAADADGILAAPRTIRVGTATTTLELAMPDRATLAYRVRDPEGRALPSKLTVVRRNGTMPSLPRRYGVVPRPMGIHALRFDVDGEGELRLAAGTYDVTISRGSEYTIASASYTLDAGDSERIDATLTRVVDTRGWIASDTHLHAMGSSDSSDAFEAKVAALAAEGVELPVSTEHEALGDFGPAIEALGLRGWLRGVVGTEVTTSNVGHFNAFPLEADLSLPGRGRIDWFGKDMPTLFAMIRANPAGPIIQVNHPRWGMIGGYFDAMRFDAARGASDDPRFSTEFDTVEVVSKCDRATFERTTLTDWLGLLRAGHRRAATGGSDSHIVALDEVGYPKTYVAVPTDAPEDVRLDDVRRAFLEGRVVISCGAFLELTAGDARIGDLVPGAATLRVRARVAAPAWVDVDAVEILRGDVVVERRALAAGDGDRGVVELDVPLEAGRDSFVWARAVGDRRMGPHAQQAEVFSFTNPIFVDGDGDGRWAPSPVP